MKGRQFVPQQLQPYQDLIERFLANFNLLCRRTGRNYIIKEFHNSYENVDYNKYKVVYISEYENNKWVICGQYRELIFFKQKFPLFEIRIIEGSEKLFTFFGLYTAGLEVISFEVKSLHKALQYYTDKCMRVPVEAFTKG